MSKIIFLVDRKDLDDQTIREYNSFEHDCVDRSCSTSHLVAQLKKDDAKLIVTTIQKLHHALNSEQHHQVMERIKEQRDVKIFNNSWGWTEYMPLVDEEGDGNLYSVATAHELYPQWDPDVITIANYAMAHPESLFVFAAGNSGFTDPGMGPAALPYFYGNDLSNLLSVVSVNPYEIERNADGTLQVNVGGVSEFSNLAGAMALYSVSAPGTHIYSLNSTDLGYITMDGTSMAAPSVSGAAALVAQAYPWVSGKQIADTILTNANHDFVIEPLISTPDQPEEDLRVALLFADPLGAGTFEEWSLKILLIDYEGNTVHPYDPSQSQQQSDASQHANTIIQRYFEQGVENSFILNIAANPPSVRAGIRPRHSWNCVTLFRGYKGSICRCFVWNRYCIST